MLHFIQKYAIWLLFGYCALIALAYRPLYVQINSHLLLCWGEDYVFWREAIQSSFPLPDFCVYNLPGACWIALLTWLGLQLGQRRPLLYFPLYLLPFAIGQGMELTQLIGITDGTYDPLDALVNTLGFAIPVLCYSYQRPSKETNKMLAKRWQFITFLLVFLAAFSVDV